MVWRRVRPEGSSRQKQSRFSTCVFESRGCRQADGQAAVRSGGRRSIQGGGEGYKRREVKCTGCWRRNRTTMEMVQQCFCVVLYGRETKAECGME